MANTNAPFGFIPYDAEGRQIRVHQYVKASGILYPGDALTATSAGAVTVAAAGSTVIGVAAEYQASASTSILVYDDPEIVYMCMALGDFQQTDVNTSANIDATTGDTAIKRSKNSLDLSTKGTGATLQFKMLGLVPQGENAVGSFAKIKVRTNHSSQRAGVSGI